jgi:hypothetical protein
VPVQAIPQALLASLYPLGLAMVLVLAAASRPRAKAGAFLIGAAVCTLAVGFAVVFALRGAGLAHRGERPAHYGVRLAFGLLLMIAAVAVARWPATRWGRARAEAKARAKAKAEAEAEAVAGASTEAKAGGSPGNGPGLVARIRASANQADWVRRAKEGGLIVVFLVGIAMYLPSPVYLSALERVGSSRLSVAALVGWVILVSALVLITIEVPILLFVFAPGWTIPKLRAADAWVARNKRTLIVIVLAVLGVWETADGLIGLVT